MSEQFGPDIVSVIDEDGKEHVFEELDRIETDEGRFVALTPCHSNPQELIDDSCELIILQVTEEDGETYLSQIEDEKIFTEVGTEFERRLSEFYDFSDTNDYTDDNLVSDGE